METRSGTKRKKKKNQSRQLLITGCLVILLLIVFLVLLLFLPVQDEPAQANAQFDVFSVFSQEPKVPSNVIISGYPVGGMTEERVTSFLESVLEPVNSDMTLMIGGKRLILSPDVTGVHWDIQEAVNLALSGKGSSVQLKINSTAVTEALQDFMDSIGGIYSPSAFWLEGTMPDLQLHEGANQVLNLRQGSDGYSLDLYDLCEQILQSYISKSYEILVPDLGERKEAKPLDLESIYQQVTTLPVNPDLDRKTLDLIPGRDGYGFDMNQAETLLQNVKSGETIRLEMDYISPPLSEDDVWFQDTLGYCKTEYTDNEDRNENLRLACSKINGIILQPGETLSYNQILGERTREAGFRPAPAYSGVELVNEIGGGICQVSSTLYLSALFAELNIVERKNHGFPANYIPLGLDATVNWGTTDLKLKNDYTLPVKILAEVSDGYVKVRIMGVEQRDYYVKMEYRVDDHPSYAAAFRCRYDRSTDELLERYLDHTSIYLEEVWCWPGFIQSATDE